MTRLRTRTPILFRQCLVGVLFTLCALFHIILPASGQSPAGITMPVVTPPSPAASSLGKFAAIPTGTYTGIPEINIPLQTIEAGSFKFHIGLSYHSHGNKVNEDASPIGLGWAITSSGVITRAKSGLDDFGPNGFYKYNAKDEFESGNGMDWSPDIFYYNFSGYTGKFLMRYAPETSLGYEVVILEQEKLKIQLLTDTTWKITSADGVVFNFTKKERRTEIEQSTYNFHTGHYISSWYLSSIITPSGQQVGFEYQNLNSHVRQYHVSRSQTNSFSNCPDYDVPPFSSSKTEVTTHTQQTILKKISYPNGHIDFGIANRIDLNSYSGIPQRVSEMKTYSNTLGLLRRYVFVQDYFNSGSGSADYLSKRLRLTGLDEYGQSGNPKKHYFIYNGITLPDKNSTAKDHWGFYNGAGSGNREPHSTYVLASLLKTIVFPTGGKINYVFESNDYSNYDNQFMKDVPPYAADAVNSRVGVGCRIARTEVFDRNNKLLKSRRYSYRKSSGASSGKRMSGGLYHYKQYQHEVSEDCPAGVRITHFVITSENNFSLGEGASGFPVGYDMVTEEYKLSGDNGKIEYYFKNVPEVLPNHIGVPNYVYNGNGFLIRKVMYKALGSAYEKVYAEGHVMNVTNSKVIDARARAPATNVTSVYKTVFVPYQIPSDFIYTAQSTDTLFSRGNTKTVKSRRFYYDNIAHLQPTRIETQRSGNKKETVITTYPLDYSNTNGFIKDMKDRHLVVFPIEQVRYLENGSTKTILSGSITKYKAGSKGLKDRELLLETKAPISSGSFKFSNRATGILPPSGTMTAFLPDSRYKARLIYDLYDTDGNLKQYTLSDGTSNSYLWGYNGQYPVAEAKNAVQSDIAYTGFESESRGNWSYNGTVGVNAAYALTGKKYYAISGGMSKSRLVSSKNYLLSYWQKVGTVNVSGGTVSAPISGRNHNGWTYIERNINGATSISLSGSGYIDGVRLYPKEAEMTTYSYEPLVGITSQVDASDKVTYYQYDDFQRLKTIRDLNNKLIEDFRYNYGTVNNVPVPTVYYSEEVKGTFTKNDCPSGEFGEMVEYVVSEGKYSSTISQADADQKAIVDFNANGQTYANEVGDCFSRTAVFSVQTEVPNAYAYYITFVRTSDGQVFEFDQATIESSPNIELENGTYEITVEFQDGSTEFDLSGMQSLRLFNQGGLVSCINYSSAGYPGDSGLTFQDIIIGAPDSVIILFSTDPCN